MKPGRWLRAAAVSGTALVAMSLVSCEDDGGGDTTASTDGASDELADEAIVVSGSGDVESLVEDYRELLGPDNGGAPDPQESGRREINWDAVPDEFAAPNAFPGNFFNAVEEPRARGIVLQTPGEFVAVSADTENDEDTPVRFGDVNASYSDTFQTFSAERLFSPIGSNVVDATFYVPGTDTPAAVRGFGAVYTDVDKEETAAFEFFDADGSSLGSYTVPVSEDGLSFLGVAFPDPIVARVRIVYGNTELGPDDSARYDVAVMDDFIFGEPQPLDG